LATEEKLEDSNSPNSFRNPILIRHLSMGHSQESSMLVTFTTKAYADITMFGDVAIAMLKMMGHSGTSAILAEDIPAALSRLIAAVNAGKSPPSPTEKDADESVVSTAHRALPLINLLTAAAKNGCDVMWK
jgi:hypothetical protein